MIKDYQTTDTLSRLLGLMADAGDAELRISIGFHPSSSRHLMSCEMTFPKEEDHARRRVDRTTSEMETSLASVGRRKHLSIQLYFAMKELVNDLEKMGSDG